MTKLDSGPYLLDVKKLDAEVLEKKFFERGLSQSAVAERLGVSREAVSQWMLGKSFPRPKALLDLSSLSGLRFEQLVVAEPAARVQFAYRTNRKAKVSEELRSRAEDIAKMLAQMLPYFLFETSFAPPLLSDPQNDEGYIRKVARELRTTIGCPSGGVVQEKSLIGCFDRLRTVFIPVLWGENGPDALHIGLEGNTANFIYINVQKKMSDLKYWMVHELAHLLTPSLGGEEGESFADALASVVLYPDEAAAAFAPRLERSPTIAAWVASVVQEASTFGISPITVWLRTKQYAESRGMLFPEIDIYGAATNYAKTVNSLAEVLYGEEYPSVEKYILDSQPWFGGRFFDGLCRYLRSEKKGATAVQQALGISLSDAKGVWDYLAHT